jgi:predicted nucleic acid-binding protein
LPVKKIIDSNIFIYALLQDHPAQGECAAFLDDNDAPGVLYSLVDCIDETYWILKNVYRIEASAILQKLEGLINTNIVFLGLDIQEALESLEILSNNPIQITDARLFVLASTRQVPMIVTDDIRFQKFSKSRGLLTQTPITQNTRDKMNEWEKTNLPITGLPRVLARIYEYLVAREPKAASSFKQDTFHFSRLPGL